MNKEEEAMVDEYNYDTWTNSIEYYELMSGR